MDPLSLTPVLSQISLFLNLLLMYLARSLASGSTTFVLNTWPPEAGPKLSNSFSFFSPVFHIHLCLFQGQFHLGSFRFRLSQSRGSQWQWTTLSLIRKSQQGERCRSVNLWLLFHTLPAQRVPMLFRTLFRMLPRHLFLLSRRSPLLHSCPFSSPSMPNASSMMMSPAR